MYGAGGQDRVTPWGGIIRKGLEGADNLLLPDLNDAVIWVCSLGEVSPSCFILTMRVLFCIDVYFDNTSFFKFWFTSWVEGMVS